MSAELPVKIENGMLHFKAKGEFICAACGIKGNGDYMIVQPVGERDLARDLHLRFVKGKVTR